MINTTIKISMPGDTRELIGDIPTKDATPAVIDDIMAAFATEFLECVNEASRAKGQPFIIFNPMRKSGDQYIWEFEVKDLAKPDNPDKVNWHLQNTSQWLYAGCILLQNGRVSRHH